MASGTNWKIGAAGLLAAAAMAWSVPALSQGANEQFVPVLVYRSGPYAPNGVPWANGFVDYLNLVNERDGGINGVRIAYEECEFGYATDRGVECYERLKRKGPTGAAVFNPLSTGVTFALTEKAPVDKIPVITMGYGRSESADGSVFAWNFPLLGTYWTATDIIMRHIATKNGGYDKLKGKKVTLVYHDSPYGKEPIPLLSVLEKRHGFQFKAIPVTHPGVEQKSAWLQIRQDRPDFVLLWGWGVMNSAAIKEAAAVNFPRDRMYGVWWSGAEPDVLPAEQGSIGYNAAALQHSAGQGDVHKEILKHVHAKNKGTGKAEEVGQVLYNRGMINAMVSVEAIRKAQERHGKKPLTGEQVRWGIENMELSDARLKQLGFAGIMQPLKVTCNDHEGVRKARIHQWDGKGWKFVSDWIEGDNKLLRPMVEEAAKRYAKEKGITARDCSKEK